MMVFQSSLIFMLQKLFAKFQVISNDMFDNI